MRIDHPLDGHAGSIYVVVVGLDIPCGWPPELDPLSDAGLRECDRCRHDTRTGCLRDFSVPGDAATYSIPFQFLLFPFYVGWKLVISLAGRPRQWVRTAREP